jgi:hypothetical protein
LQATPSSQRLIAFDIFLSLFFIVFIVFIGAIGGSFFLPFPFGVLGVFGG